MQSVNLVRGRRPHIFDRALAWSVSVGRVLIMITEIVALSAFAYRFYLDRQIIDLKDQIAQKQSVVAFFAPSEEQYRNLIDRLSIAKKAIAQEVSSQKVFLDINALIPQTMQVRTLTYQPESIRIDGATQSVIDLATFVTNVRGYPQVQGVSLDKIENKTTTGTVAVTLTINLKQPSQPTRRSTSP